LSSPPSPTRCGTEAVGEARAAGRRRGFLGHRQPFPAVRGAKDLDLLKSVDPKLEQVVSFGWLSILAKPLFLVVNWFHKSFIHNFGWSIVLVTIIINVALFPLRFSNMKSMRKMQALKPQLDTINAKYKKLSLTDPRKATSRRRRWRSTSRTA